MLRLLILVIERKVLRFLRGSSSYLNTDVILVQYTRESYLCKVASAINLSNCYNNLIIIIIS